MQQAHSNLLPEVCRTLLAEIEPRSTFMTVRPMGADGTHPAYVIEARSATGTVLQLAVECYRHDVGPAAARARREFKTLQMLQKHAVPVPTHAIWMRRERSWVRRGSSQPLSRVSKFRITGCLGLCRRAGASAGEDPFNFDRISGKRMVKKMPTWGALVPKGRGNAGIHGESPRRIGGLECA